MIVCDCGWLAIARNERRAWDDHKRGTRCRGQYRVLPSPRIAGKHRARLCIHGHERDVLGVCWTCLTARERLEWHGSNAGVAISAAETGDPNA